MNSLTKGQVLTQVLTVGVEAIWIVVQCLITISRGKDDDDSLALSQLYTTKFSVLGENTPHALSWR